LLKGTIEGRATRHRRQNVKIPAEKKSMRYAPPLALSALVLIATHMPANSHTAHDRPEETVPRPTLALRPLATFKGGGFGKSAAEVVAYDATRKRLYVTNSDRRLVDVLDIQVPDSPKRIHGLAAGKKDGEPTSVAVHGDLIAVALPNKTRTEPGRVAFFNPDGDETASVTVGALPDMVAFDPSGNRVLVANEGEPDDDYKIDPEGSVSIIDLSNGLEKATVKTADFRAFGESRQLPAGVRVFGPRADAAHDLEPEYVAVCPQSSSAFVTLQENNAIAKIDIDKAEVTEIFALGTKDHSAKGNGLDASAEDQLRIFTWPVLGMYQPDSVACARVGGKNYLFTANEGDSRVYDGFSEVTRVSRVSLDPDVFGKLKRIQSPDRLGDLRISKVGADTDGDGDVDRLYTFGGRSFSILSTDGKLVYESGDAFERIVARVLPEGFNSSNVANDSFDERSPHKGPEPEGLAVGEAAGRTFLFVSLERVGGVIAFDVSSPTAPKFAAYANNRDFSGSPKSGTAGDLGPEGLAFIPAADAPGAKPLLVTANEISGTTTIWEITPIADPEAGAH
jgi:DNA-binding beta-propeller fold protein YncE